MADTTTDKRVLIALAVIAAVVVLLGIRMCGGADTSSPEAAVESYFAAVADGDADEACSVGTEAFRQEAVASVIGTPSEGETCEETVENVPDEARDLLGEVEVVTTERSGDAAIVEVTVDADDFAPQPIRYDVVHEEDGWRIAGYSSEPAPAT